MAAKSCYQQTVIFDGKRLIIQTLQRNGIEIEILAQEIRLISFGRESTGGYAVFLTPGASVRVPFRSWHRKEFEKLKDVVEHAARVEPVQPRDAASQKDFDPAALLVAVVAVAIGPLLGHGLWRSLDMIVALVVLAVVVAYSLRQPERSSMSVPERISVSLVIGLISGTVLAWPVQQLIVLPYWPASNSDASGDRVTNIGLGAGLVIALALWAWLQRQKPRDGTHASGNA